MCCQIYLDSVPNSKLKSLPFMNLKIGILDSWLFHRSHSNSAHVFMGHPVLKDRNDVIITIVFNLAMPRKGSNGMIFWYSVSSRILECEHVVEVLMPIT